PETLVTVLTCAPDSMPDNLEFSADVNEAVVFARMDEYAWTVSPMSAGCSAVSALAPWEAVAKSPTFAEAAVPSVGLFRISASPEVASQSALTLTSAPAAMPLSLTLSAADMKPGTVVVAAGWVWLPAATVPAVVPTFNPA